MADVEKDLTNEWTPAISDGVTRRPPRRFDPASGAREELRLAKEELGRAKAITVQLEERIARLEAWLSDAERHGLNAATAPLPELPVPRTAEFGQTPGGVQWGWARYILLQFDDPVSLSTIAERIVQEGGPVIPTTSLGSLLRKREIAGDVDHIGRTWRLKR